MTPPPVPLATQAREGWHQDAVGCREGGAEGLPWERGVQSTGSTGGGCWVLGVPLTPSEAQSGVTGATLHTRASFFHCHHPWGRGLHIASSLGRGPWLPSSSSTVSHSQQSVRAEAANPIPQSEKSRGQTAVLSRHRCQAREHQAALDAEAETCPLRNSRFGFPYVVSCPACLHARLSEIPVSFSCVPLSLTHTSSQHPWAFQNSSSMSPLLGSSPVSWICSPFHALGAMGILLSAFHISPRARKGAKKGSRDRIPFLSVSPTPSTVPGIS